MKKNTNIEKTLKKLKYNPGLVVKITAEKVRSIHIAKVLAQCPEKVIFTEKVKNFEWLAFKDIDCSRFDFSTAVNLSRIGTKCFKNAKNIHWSETLDCPDQEIDAFEDAQIIGKENQNTI